MSVWTWAWLAWIAAFLAIEGLALADKDREDTLSEHVWKWFGVRGPDAGLKGWPTVLGLAARGLLLIFLTWLLLHLSFGWLSF